MKGSIELEPLWESIPHVSHADPLAPLPKPPDIPQMALSPQMRKAERIRLHMVQKWGSARFPTQDLLGLIELYAPRVLTEDFKKLAHLLADSGDGLRSSDLVRTLHPHSDQAPQPFQRTLVRHVEKNIRLLSSTLAPFRLKVWLLPSGRWALMPTMSWIRAHHDTRVSKAPVPVGADKHLPSRGFAIDKRRN